MKKGARETGIDHMGAMRAFVRVVETGSFSAVAKEMHVSTSTVARKVTAIEEALGVALLHRSTHSVTLTEPAISTWNAPSR
ncbi:HTH-type transcriptional activator AllS [Burkholderia cepacia]|nr:HTH-type transcriptional activator AllS [Burkholderia cepacia]